MNVKILTHTQDPEKTVAMAAKLCYSSCGVEDLYENMTEGQIVKMIKMLHENEHYSPMEHASFTFAIEGVSRALTHQLVRHRIASYSQQSQRYVSMQNFEYVTPSNIKCFNSCNEYYDKAMENLTSTYNSLRKNLLINYSKFYYDDKYIDSLYDKYRFDVDKILEHLDKEDHKLFSLIEKMANEDARYVLPNSCCSKIIVTMNSRELLSFFNLRMCNRAQAEIVALSKEMYRQVRAIAPNIFATAGPDCRTKGYCSESGMQCLQFKDIIPTKDDIKYYIDSYYNKEKSESHD